MEFLLHNAHGRTRTYTSLRTTDFESVASSYFATHAERAEARYD